HAMAKKGQAGRALGASLTSSLIGAIVGAAALALAIPVVRPLVLTFGSPEFFMLSIVGIAFIASLSGRGPRGMIRGFLAGCLGLLLAAVGQDPQMGIQRYTLSSLYLWNGLNLVPVLVGFFAIPEIIDLAVRGTAIAADAPMGRLSQVREGVFDALRHIWLTIRCSLIGTYIGIIPVVVSVVFLNRLARLTNIRGGLLIPFLALLTFLGAYTSSNSLNDIVVTLIFGWFGYLMVRYRWPRAPLVLGLVLGDVAERYLWISVARYGSAWLTRPIVVILILLIVGVIGSSIRQRRMLPTVPGV